MECIGARIGNEARGAKRPRTSRGGVAGLALSALCAAACSNGGGKTSTTTVPATVPDFAAATFSDPATVDHPLYPLLPGSVRTFTAETDEGVETILLEALDETRVVMGVECAVVRDRVFVDGLLVEDTHDWFAQDDAGNVWYMGEEVDNYEYDDEGALLGVDHEGAWEAGLDVAGVGAAALPGHVMRAAPAVGDRYSQEYYPGLAEDLGTVVALGVPVTLEDGSSYTCLQVRDSTPLEPGAEEDKFYAPGLGLVREADVGAAEGSEWRGTFVPGVGSVPAIAAAAFSDPGTIDAPFLSFPVGSVRTYLARSEDETEVVVVEALDETRTVLGLECAVVRDRVFVEGLLIEDTHDWFAQDDAGNVWYMGEEVDNYEYDDEGELLGVDHEGAWEAGLDVLGSGSVALPGYQIQGAPVLGLSFHQEFYEDEAEDMAYVAGLDEEVELEDGSVFEGCVRMLEWNPAEPDSLEYKFYAPGTGVVLEEKLGGEEQLELLGTFEPGRASVPDFAAATFGDPATIDNELLPFPVGSTRTYASETEDGPETIVVEVLDVTRTVMGVECAVVRDRVWLDGLLIEDTHDWYAQDDAGNVWYMGEEVDNYEYDDDGTLLGVDHDGAWEAGTDPEGTGDVALPGFVMRAEPAPGDAYHQEFYAEEAEDMAFVAASDVTVELAGGVVYEGCLQVLEWNPLDPGALEYKFHAPGVGVVLEEVLHDDERVELLSVDP